MDEPDFPFATPALDFLFARDRGMNIRERLEVDEAKDFIPRRESGDEALAMLDHSRLQIACYACVEIPGTTGEDVDAIGTIHAR